MIDFDYCIVDSFLHDLSSIIIRCLKYGHWNFDTLDFIIDTYSQNTKVDNKDLYLIFCFMEFPQDFWQVGLQYYVEKQPWSEEVFIKRLRRIVGDCKERMEFMGEFQLSFLEGANIGE
jgi:CotS family spore coat protein